MRHCIVFVSLVGLAGCAAAQSADRWQEVEGWHTLHYDVQRSGRHPAQPRTPFEKVWHRELWKDILSPAIEPIVAEGKVFVGTWGGTVYALSAETGKDAWKAQATGGVRHAMCYDPANKTVLYATMGDHSGAAVVARRASDGQEVWSFRTDQIGGFATSPAVYRDKVYIGDRAGVFYCLDAKTGKEIWRWVNPSGAPFYQTAAARDGKVIVAGEDMKARCFDESGKLLWTSAKMQGDSLRFYYPVFWNDTVIFRTPAPDSEISAYQDAVIDAAGADGKKWREIFKEHAWQKPYWDFNNSKYKLYTDQKFQAEQAQLRKDIQSGRLQQTFYWLNVADGKERRVTSIGYSGSENGYSVPTPPCLDDEGNLYVLFKSFWSPFEFPIRQFDAIGTLDYQTGLPKILPKAEGRNHFPITADEANTFTWGGDATLYGSHDHSFVYWDEKTRKVVPAFAPKTRWETWGGVYLTTQQKQGGANPLYALETDTASLLINVEWNGTSRGSFAFVGNRVYWATGSMIVCLEGESK